MTDVSITRLYFNPEYQGCDDKPCYFFYIPNGGAYVITPDEVYKALEVPTFELTDENVDSYAEARGFFKIIERSSDYGTITYFNGFDSPEKREDIARHMNQFNFSIADKTKALSYVLRGTKPISLCYSVANSIESKVW